MNLIPRHRFLSLGLAALLGAGLAACGGGNSTDAPVAATFSLADDSATVPWNRPATVDVIANDHASSGTLTISAVGQPAHGSAAITNGKLVYTPAANYFGADSVTYTASVDGGSASASARVDFSVHALLNLHGVAADAPLAGATITATVGSGTTATRFTTTADASGAYTLPIEAAEAQAFVRIEAAGSGAQAAVRLVSLVGEASSLVALADDAGLVEGSRVAALAVSHFSTAAAALMTRSVGSEPASAAALAVASGSYGGTDLINLATLIHLVADEGVALPSGFADTWSLALDSAAATALIAARDSPTDFAAATAFAAASSRALATAPASPFGLPGTASVSLVVFPGNDSQSAATLVRLDPGGRAHVTTRQGEVGAAWTSASGSLNVVYDQPFSELSDAAEADPALGHQAMVRNDTLGLRVQLLAPGSVAYSETATQTYLEGSRAGQTQSIPAQISVQRLVTDPAGVPIGTGEFASGSRWGGVVGKNSLPLVDQDVLLMTSASSGRAERNGVVVGVTISGGTLTLAGDDGTTRDYVRLMTNAATGVQFWMLVDRTAAVATSTQVVMVPLPSALALDTTQAARIWQWDSGDPSIVSLYALDTDGRGNISFGGGPSAVTWSVGADGHLRIVRVNSQQTQIVYDWIPLAKVGNRLFVLRAVQFVPAGRTLQPDSGQYVLFVYLDSGPGSS